MSVRGELSLAEIIRSPLSYDEKAKECLARLGLRESDDVDLRCAAIVYAVLEVANELYRANPE